MKLDAFITKICQFVAARRPVRVIDGEQGDVYLERYYLFGRMPAYFPKGMRTILSFLPTVVLHHFCRSDADHELHNHPWAGYSLILTGGYKEERRFPLDLDDRTHVPFGKGWRRTESEKFRSWRNAGANETSLVLERTYFPGDVNVLRPDDFHRVDLLQNDCWTLFVIGEKVQRWGFWSRYTNEFTPSREFFARKAAERDQVAT